MATIMSDNLQEMEPAMAKVASLLERVNETTDTNRRIFLEAAERVDGHMTGLFGMIETLFDSITEASATVQAGGTTSGGGRLDDAGLSAAQDQETPISPPSSNTGANFSQKTQNGTHLGSKLTKPAKSTKVRKGAQS